MDLRETQRRVHPLTPVLKSFTLLAAVLAWVAFNMWQAIADFGALLSDWALAGVAVAIGIVVLAIIVIALLAWVSWRYIFYELTDQEVLYGSGWIIRSRRNARLDRVQAVDINQPLLPRLFGLAEIVIETAGGKDSHFKVQYLTHDECVRFRAEVLAEVEKLDTGLASGQAAPTNAQAADFQPAGTIIDARTIYGPLPVALLAASVCIGPGLFLGVFAVIAGVIAAFFTDFVAEMLTGITIGTVIAVGGVIASIFMTLSGSWEFTLRTSSKSRRLSVTAGLLETRAQSIPIDRVHGIKVIQPLWWRPWKWSRAELSVAGYGIGDKDTHNTLVPIAPNAELDDIVADLMDEIAGPERSADQAASLGAWETPASAWWLSPIDWKYQRVRATRQGLLVTNGKFWHTKYLVPWQRIQGHTLSISPFGKAAGVANVRIDMVPGSVAPIAAQLRLQDAYDLAAVIQKHKVV